MLTDEALRVVEVIAGYIQPDETIAENRTRWERIARERMAVPGDVAVESVVVDGVATDWLTAPGADPERVVLYLHGGAYMTCSARTHRDLAARLSRAAAARVLVVDYRLAPEHPFPAAVEDSVAAYRWLLAQGYQPEKITVAGDSAGGGLMLAVCLSARDAGDPLPALGVGICTWSDLTCSGQTMITNAATDPWISAEGLLSDAALYLGDTDPRHPLASPMFADLAGLPPLLLPVSADETLLDDTVRLASAARSAGVEITMEMWPGMIHDWPMFAAQIPEGQQTIERIGDVIRDRTR
jgi:acetyl esterase/lipase